MEYTYDTQGRKVTMTTFKDTNTPQITTWSYNSQGQNSSKTYADSNSVNYTYDSESRLLTRTWARQVNNQPLVTTYGYDVAGRQTGISYSDGTPSITITYNYLGLQTSVTDAVGTRNFSYNTSHLLANETNPLIVNSEANYGYDASGRRTQMSFVNGTITYALAAYTYDPQGRIATVGNGADTMTYGYVSGTQRIGSSAWSNATALNTAYAYDNYKRLTGMAVNNQPLIGYTLNAKNQRTAATLPDGNHWLYGYDPLGQLTGAEKKDSSDTLLKSFSYNYDLIGNRTNAVEDSATTTYTSNIVNQYTLINAAVPTYDLDGNMLTHGGWTYTYNGENRLVVAESSDTKLEFNYDYMGRRFEKKVYTKSLLTLYNWSLQLHRRFAYDGYKLIAEFDALNNNEQIAGYLWQPVGLDVPLMAVRDNVASYYFADGNKNVLAVKDSSGTDISAYTYTPFGAVEAPVSGDENPFRFSGEYHDDETGLVYYNYRYYSLILGRWINRDPIDEKGGVNLYGMVGNSVGNKIDSLGLLSINQKISLIFAAKILLALTVEDNYTQSYHNEIFNLDDDESEILGEIQGNLISEFQQQLGANKSLSRKWQRFSIEEVNIAQKYSASGVLVAKNFWLNYASKVFMGGHYSAKCANNIIHYRLTKIRYAWHDHIDANSFEEANNQEAFNKGYGSFVWNTAEANWDRYIETLFKTDFKVIISGIYSYPDGTKPIPRK